MNGISKIGIFSLIVAVLLLATLAFSISDASADTNQRIRKFVWKQDHSQGVAVTFPVDKKWSNGMDLVVKAKLNAKLAKAWEIKGVKVVKLENGIRLRTKEWSQWVSKDPDGTFYRWFSISPEFENCEFVVNLRKVNSSLSTPESLKILADKSSINLTVAKAK